MATAVGVAAPLLAEAGRATLLLEPPPLGGSGRLAGKAARTEGNMSRCNAHSLVHTFGALLPAAIHWQAGSLQQAFILHRVTITMFI